MVTYACVDVCMCLCVFARVRVCVGVYMCAIVCIGVCIYYPNSICTNKTASAKFKLGLSNKLLK